MSSEAQDVDRKSLFPTRRLARVHKNLVRMKIQRDLPDPVRRSLDSASEAVSHHAHESLIAQLITEFGVDKLNAGLLADQIINLIF